ncbi:UNVERIFIED_CONTAM: hypothetical protein K2H54_015765 [Gekko kuhli]
MDPEKLPENTAQNTHAAVCIEKALQPDPSVSLGKVKVLEALAEREASTPSMDPAELPENNDQNTHATVCMEEALLAAREQCPEHPRHNLHGKSPLSGPLHVLGEFEVPGTLAKREASTSSMDPEELPENTAQNTHAAVCIEKALQVDPSVSLGKVKVLEALAEREASTPSMDPAELPENNDQNTHATVCMEKALLLPSKEPSALL